jgi:hypothetical protein
MLGVSVARVLYSEVINNQTECNGTGSMGEENMSVVDEGLELVLLQMQTGRSFDGASHLFLWSVRVFT